MGNRRRRSRSTPEEDVPKKPLTEEVVQRIEKWAEEAVEVYQLSLFDVEVNVSWKIEVTIDNDSKGEPGKGVTISQCVDVSRYMEALLDTDDDVPEKYTIEVSSPGVERELTKPRHFEHCIGRTVKVVLKQPKDKQNVYDGVLVAFHNPTLEIDVNDQIHQFRLSQLAKVRLTYDFSGLEA